MRYTDLSSEELNYETDGKAHSAADAGCASAKAALLLLARKVYIHHAEKSPAARRGRLIYRVSLYRKSALRPPQGSLRTAVLADGGVTKPEIEQALSVPQARTTPAARCATFLCA